MVTYDFIIILSKQTWKLNLMKRANQSLRTAVISIIAIMTRVRAYHMFHKSGGTIIYVLRCTTNKKVIIIGVSARVD